MKDIIIPREKAIFWMDGNGRWHNEHGPFQHRKLIHYFNTAIGWDADGFFVSQVRGDIREKVYFRYAETALFAVDVLHGTEDSLLLNTGNKIRLEPEALFVRNDVLYMRHQDISVKFSDRCMMKLAESIEESDGVYYFKHRGKRYALQHA